MEKFVKFLRNLLIGVWIIVALFVTVCLLSYNDFNVTVLGKTTLLVIDNDELSPAYNDRDLVLIKRTTDSKIEVGDKVFFYNGDNALEYVINIEEIAEKEVVNPKETTYKIKDALISGNYVIGRTEDAKVIPNLGLALNIFTSQWGFMFLVILPTLFALVYEIITIVNEVKAAKKAD